MLPELCFLVQGASAGIRGDLDANHGKMAEAGAR